MKYFPFFVCFNLLVSLLVFLSVAELKRLITSLLEYMRVSSKQNLRLMRPLKLKVRKLICIHYAFFKVFCAFMCSSPLIILFLLALPHVAAYKHSENANENDKAALVCVSHGYPVTTDWSWYKLGDDESEVNKLLLNGRA